MTMNLFDQFTIPHTFGPPLVLLSALTPTMLTTTTARLIRNRTEAAQAKFFLPLTKQLMTPLNIPGHPWALPMIVLLYYLLITNLLGLLPYTFTPTAQLSMNMALAVPLWFMTVLMGFRTQPTTALAHLLPLGTPIPLIPGLILIETVSLFIRPIALGVRLTANLTAGHLLLTLISTTAMTTLPAAPGTAVLSVGLLILLSVLEIAVAMIQAYVFILLLTLYLQENT